MNKGFYINSGGLLARLMGQRYYNKVFRLEDNFLISDVAYYVAEHSESDIKTATNNILSIYNAQKARGKEFIYVQAPNQLTSGELTLPTGYENLSKAGEDKLKANLQDAGVTVIDFAEHFDEIGLSVKDYMLRTDNHWTAQGIFEAFRVITQTIVGNDFNDSVAFYTNVENYTWETYTKTGYGSYLSRCGVGFADGTGDFETITPNFDFKISYAQNGKASTQVSYKDTAFQASMIAREPYFNKSPYSFWNTSGYITRVENTDAPIDMRILMINDSMGDGVFAFLPTIFKYVDKYRIAVTVPSEYVAMYKEMYAETDYDYVIYINQRNNFSVNIKNVPLPKQEVSE